MDLVEYELFVELFEVVLIAAEPHKVLAVATAQQLDQALLVRFAYYMKKGGLLPRNRLKQCAADMDTGGYFVDLVELQDPSEPSAVTNGSKNLG